MLLGRDPAFLEYLEKIGQHFFGVPAPQRPKPGGFLGNILGNFFNAMNDDDDDDDEGDQPPMARMLGLPQASSSRAASASSGGGASSSSSNSRGTPAPAAKMETEDDLD